jgi:hypothetical protein
MTDEATARPRTTGFTLVEMVVATALAATILVSLGAATRLFSEQAEAVREREDHELDLAVTEITGAARQAWAVQMNSATDVSVADPLGNVTRYYMDAKQLKVRRPSGVVGVLASDLTSATFTVDTKQRLRDATPTSDYGTIWSSSVPAGTPDTIEIHDGQALAIGFHAPVAAPDAFNGVPGVTEEMIRATLGRLLMPVSFLDGSPMEFCHLHAPGPPHNPSHPSDTGLLTLTLYEAVVPGDARPHGAPLASTTLPTTALPAATWTWWDYHLDNPVVAPEVIDPPTGVAWGWWTDHPQVQLAVSAPMIEAPMDLSGLASVIKPGRGYTLLIEVDGYDYVSVRAIPLGAAEGSGVALRSSPGGAFTPQPMRVMASLEGTRLYTQTQARDVVSRITVNLATDAGNSMTGSAVVDGQIAAPDPWLGSVPGEAAGLVTPGS